MKKSFQIALIIATALIGLSTVLGQDQTCRFASNPAYIPQLKTKISTFIKTDLNLCSYSGLLSLRESASIFYWFFESQKNEDYKKIPVIVYLNGEVGVSSVATIFYENGPLRYNSQNKVFEASAGSLIKSANVLYLDFPEGVGFSTSSEIRNKKTLSRAELTQDFLSTITKFVEKFPDTKDLKWYIAAESYSAHLAVDFLSDAIKRKSNPSDNFKIDFKGIILGNPLLDSGRQLGAVDDLAGPLGFVAPEQMDQYSLLLNKCEVNQDECKKVTDYLRLITGNVNLYDFRDFAQNVSPDYLNVPYSSDISDIDGFFNSTDNQKELRELLHLNSSTKAPLWNYRVPEYANLLYSQFKTPVVSTLKTLSSTVKVFLYFAQFEMKFNYQGGLEIWPNLVTINNNMTRKLWREVFSNQVTTTGGYFYESGNVTLMLVSRSGHSINVAVPDVNSRMVDNFVYEKGFCFTDCNITAPLLEIIGNCSGRGNWVENLSSCNCTQDYDNVDCSVKVEDLPEGRDISLKPREWGYYKKNIDNDKVFSFELEQPKNLDVFIAYDRMAKEHDFDLQHVFYNKNTTRKRIAVQKQEGAVVYISVRNNNYDSAISFKSKVDQLTSEPEFMDDVKRPVVIVAIVLIIISLLIIIVSIVMCCKNRSSGGLLGGRL